MQSKEGKKGQDEEALKHYQMIASLLDEAKKASASGRNRRKIRDFQEKPVQVGSKIPGVIKAATLQRYLYNAGLDVKQMKRYTEKWESSLRWFCRIQRMGLLQGDIKYGSGIRLSDGKMLKIYLSSLIDEHSRFIAQSEFYDNQRQGVVEDTFHKVILKYGKCCAACYLDNGTQYTSNQFHTAFRGLESVSFMRNGELVRQGKIERFDQKVDQFIAEIRVAKVHSLEELN